MSLFPGVFVPLSFSLCTENTSYVFSFRVFVFYLVATAWIFEISFCKNSINILPLSHKSGALCLYEPLPVSDALGDDFFEIFDVFLVETFFFFFSNLLHGPKAAKKTVTPQKAIFCSLSGENNSTKKINK